MRWIREQGDAAALWLFILLTLLSLVVNLNTTPLDNIHETRVVETAREMIETGDFVLPQMAGEPRLQKPPLPYWSVTAAFGIHGAPSLLAARLTVTLLGLGMLLGTYLIGRAISGPRPAVLAVAVLGSCLLFPGSFRTVTTDPFLATLTTLSIAAFAWAMRRHGKAGSGCLAAGYLCLALALLAKGPIALVFVLLGSWAVRPPQPAARHGWSLHMCGLIAAALPLAGWALAVGMRLPESSSLWSHEVLGRVTGELAGERAPWYYLPVLLAAVAPLTVFFLAGLVRPEEEGRNLRNWFLAGFVFLVFLSSRKAAYLLPLLPAAALLIAHVIMQQEERIPGAVVRVQVLLLASLAAVLAGAGMAWSEHLGILALILLLALAAVLTAVLYSLHRNRLPVVLVLVASLLIGMFYEGVLRTSRAVDTALADMGRLIRARVPEETALYHLDAPEPRIFFYANRIPESVNRLVDLPVDSARPFWLLTTSVLSSRDQSWSQVFSTQTDGGRHYYLYEFD
jgi:4-amino-4-deoxy-L-arabinose transferase-like glycosyltransferase